MGIDYYMCHACGEATPECSYKTISFTNACGISICKWCFKKLNKEHIKPVENYKREKTSDDDSDDDSDNEYRDYDGEWEVLKAFNIIHTDTKPIKFKITKQQKTAFDKTIEDKTKSIDSLINENFKLKATHKTLQIKYNDLFEKINNEYTSKETLKRVEKEKEELTNRLNSKIEGVDIENKIVELNKKIKQLEEQLKINFYCGCLDDGEYADCASFFITCNDCGNYWKQR